MRVGLDIGSTTIKCVVLDENDTLLYSTYERHYSHILEKAQELLRRIDAEQLHGRKALLSISGSAGMGLADSCGVPFVQEVFSTRVAVKKFVPATDCVIELGGEDAKILFLTNGTEVRMNGSCAGGTGAFIDQMATLLKMSADEMNKAAEQATRTYTIASRCGVFAKSDVQPLINQGAKTEDIAASIYKAVVNQTIAGLAQGRPIKGNILYLGGPLTFSTVLRKSFDEALGVTGTCPENSLLYVALGAALYADKEFVLSDVAAALDEYAATATYASEPPLFANKEEYEVFHARHMSHSVPRVAFGAQCGPVHIGIDSGSTTVKLVVVDEKSQILYTNYQPNLGNPLPLIREQLIKIYREHPGLQVASVTTTGYGEELVKNAFRCDYGLVETVAHFTAAKYFMPDVDFIIDIGGQDMKCFKIEDGAISNIFLNEACSSGCGSFLQTFAQALGYDVKKFAALGLFADRPVDLGSRCTVFMNSSVKQAQKDGASIENISAGLSISVVKNALYKVIRASSPEELGRRIVVQGGTFYNEAVLRAFEKEMGVEVIRPDIAGLMGAYGAALFGLRQSHKNHQETSRMMNLAELEAFDQKVVSVKCGGCGNHCQLTVNTFADGRKFISGNRCERGIGGQKNAHNVPNLYEYKLHRLFSYESLDADKAPRGVVGIPRVLNMYEDYPFWFTFFTELGYRVVLSPSSNRKIYELGIESIPSESECYPAKLAHGHVTWLIRQGIKFIFYPALFYERNEFEDANNHYNCPIVTSYSENIKNNVEEIAGGEITFRNPFMSFRDLGTVTDALTKEFTEIPAAEIAAACEKGWKELANARHDMEKKGEETLEYLRKTGKRGIVLAGRPYHVDPEINHGIPELITSYDMAVLTEDSISHLAKPERPLIVSDQWMYHSRLYAAASYVKTVENLDLIQLNSFGCGLDAVTTDQVNDILSGSDKIYTCLKIDEVNNLGAARIRIRSLLSAIRVREKMGKHRNIRSSAIEKVPFTEEMRKDYTIICPQMSPIHFEILQPAFNACGYNFVVLDNDNKHSVDVGLKYVNNDACYPSLLVVGQIMEALLSGKYDLNKTAIIMSQTGGGCRATNYIGFIRRALKKADMEQIPVISLNLAGIESNPGFHLNADLLLRAAVGAEFGDIFMRCVYRMRPYEATPGSVDALHKEWLAKVQKFVSAKHISIPKFRKMCVQIIRDFDAVPVLDIKKPRVGVVGEILVKFSPAGNNHLVELLESEGAEAVVPDLIDFMLYCFYNQIYKAEHLGTSKKTAKISALGIWAIEHILRGSAVKAFEESKHFDPPTNIYKIVSYAEPIVSIGNQTGEGWFLTGEMVELIKEGVPNIVCTQPFGCLPNHITGEGMIHKLHMAYPEAVFLPLDCDASASEANQENRLKLMMNSLTEKETHEKTLPFIRNTISARKGKVL